MKLLCGLCVTLCALCGKNPNPSYYLTAKSARKNTTQRALRIKKQRVYTGLHFSGVFKNYISVFQ